MLKKFKQKRILAGLMAVLILINGFLPNLQPLKTYAFTKPYGLCIDSHTVTENARWRTGDVYAPVMIDLDKFTYGTPEYDNALEQNVQRLKAHGINESNALKLFWVLVSAFYSNKEMVRNNIIDGQQKVYNAIYWYNESIKSCNDSEAHQYINPKIEPKDYLGLNELDVGQVLHGNQWQQKIQGRPLLAMLGEESTFMGDVANWDKGLNAVMPRIKRSWVESYKTYGEEKSGYATWPVGSGAKSFSKPQSEEADVNIVAKVALDMEKDPNYWENKDSNSNSNSNSGSTANTENITNDTDTEESDNIDKDDDNDNEDDEDDDNSETGNSSKNSHEKGHYVINMTDTFYNNSGLLKIHDGNGWVGYSPLLGITTGATINVNGWEISTKHDKGYYIDFKWTGGDNPKSLACYFDIPAGSIASVGDKTYVDAMHFVATYLDLWVCVKATDGNPQIRQRFASLKPNRTQPSYPAFRIGDPAIVKEPGTAEINFKIYRHTEDFTTNYNVSLNKYDYETGKPLEKARFDLYERFDDKDLVDEEKDNCASEKIQTTDGNDVIDTKAETDDGKPVYAGKEYTGSDKYDGGITHSPVIWDDFRKAGSGATDKKGNLSFNLQKTYHYEKTFCDGHPAPSFVPVPEPDEDKNGEITNRDEIDAAKEQNKAMAKLWQTYYEDDIKMAQNDKNGNHFHWLMDGVDVGKINEIASSGGEEGETPDAGPTESASVDDAYDKSGCHQDLLDTYEKFANLKYSYTFIENKAREGYIRHDNHPDDVPIEVITTNSSEAGAKSSFANEYSRNIKINKNAQKTDINNTDKDKDKKKNERINLFSSYKEDSLSKVDILLNNVKENKDILNFKKDIVSNFLDNLKIATPSNLSVDDVDLNDEFNEDNIKDYSISFDKNNKETIETPEQSIFTKIINKITNKTDVFADEDDKKDNQSGSGGNHGAELDYSAEYMAVWDEAFTVSDRTGGKAIEDGDGEIPAVLGKHDVLSHIDDKDSEGINWRVYDHRTEGEIHFNKRDMYLDNNKNENFDSYGIAQGDGSLEGAVYGLFAKTDIINPDGKTGVVYKKGNLVSIGTTDRNGNGSFMVNTEAPGTVYNYKTGMTEKTDWYNKAPKNVFDVAKKDSFKDTDVSSVADSENSGKLQDTSWYVDDYTEDNTYKDAPTKRLYDDNENNNMNGWIGRPLFLGEYYIKELSRSEGYELSINAKAASTTSKTDNFDYLDNVDDKGTVYVSTQTYIHPQENIHPANHVLFEITSKDTGAKNNGYDIVLTNFPEHGKLYAESEKMVDSKQKVQDGYEYVPAWRKPDGTLTAEDLGNANIAWKIASGDKTDPKLDKNGKQIVIGKEKVSYNINNLKRMKNISFNDSNVDDLMPVEQITNQDGTITLKDEYSEKFESSYSFYLTKEILEKGLRKSKFNTPIAKSDGKIIYSTKNLPVYSKGVKKGNIDSFGLTGPIGGTAKRTVYGEGLVAVKIPKIKNDGKHVTIRDVVKTLYDFYKENPIYTFGGIDDYRETRNNYVIELYVGNKIGHDGYVATVDDEDIIVRAIPWVPADKNNLPKYVYVTYKPENGNYNSFGEYTNFEEKTNGISADLVPDVIVSPVGDLNAREINVYEYYKKGETVLDKDGNKIRELVAVPKFKEIDSKELRQLRTEIPVVYKDGKYIAHISMPFNIETETINDDTEKTIKFVMEFNNPKEHVLTNEDIEGINDNYYTAGMTAITGEYEVIAKGAKAFVYYDANKNDEKMNDTYVKDVVLTYPGDSFVYQDGDKTPGKGTIANHIGVVERYVGQQIKIIKKIDTLDNKEYKHDTYVNAHQDNLNSAMNKRTTDWLENLEREKIANEKTNHIPNFKFKAYLKSNIERLYRDENGMITWLDRNGNPLVPSYIDTNNDGNYDTFVWKNGTQIIDFPEQNEKKDNQMSTNVQKIYTKVEHKKTSTTTGDISNNVWAKYNDPQINNETINVGEKRGYNTSIDVKVENGEAINSNSALYSFNGNNENTRETDKVNETQNKAYTRLLETRVYVKNDGTKLTKNLEDYNYEKFFDALRSANEDKWDNDMYVGTNQRLDMEGKHTSLEKDKNPAMNNYPGQNWFDTFNEKYQKDDNDTDHTLENTDKMDKHNTAGGDKDTSFKPFQWIRENIFGVSEEDKNNYPATHNNDNLENVSNTSKYAHINAEASDNVRQFAIKWYLDDEVAKLVKNNGYDEDVAKKGSITYQEEIYDLALYNALEKTYNYLLPFYDNDLDTIYAVAIDGEENGGADGDITTLNVGTEYNKDTNSYYYGISSYVPYGDYIIVEQQPTDFETKHFITELPKIVSVPTVYQDGTNIEHDYYKYNSSDKPDGTDGMTGKYMIRYNEEFADTLNKKRPDDDDRNYLIRAHNFNGDFEVFKYGLDVDKLTGEINGYNYKGYSITQEEIDPLKDYYNYTIVDSKKDGGSENSHYFADDENKNVKVSNGGKYEGMVKQDNNFVDVNPTPEAMSETKTILDSNSEIQSHYFTDVENNATTEAIEKRYHFGSISENAGKANNVLFASPDETSFNNPDGYYYKNDVNTLTGNRTAFDGKYASQLVNWTMTKPDTDDTYSFNDYKGYADIVFTNRFKNTEIRIEKIDSETNENIIHDGATFSIYTASRYNTQDEINEVANSIADNTEKEMFLKQTKPGDVKFYMTNQEITGTKEFLTAMNAINIEPMEDGQAIGTITDTKEKLMAMNAINITPVNPDSYEEVIPSESKTKGTIETLTGKFITDIRISDTAICTGDVQATKEYLKYKNATNIRDIKGYTGIVKGTVAYLNNLNAKEILPSEEDAYVAKVHGTKEQLETLGAVDIHLLPNNEYEGTLTGTKDYLESLPNATEITTSKNDIYRGIIEGNKPYLVSLKAKNIQPMSGNLYKGTVLKGTPIAIEHEQIVMLDSLGRRYGDFKAYSTMEDTYTLDENTYLGEISEDVINNSRLLQTVNADKVQKIFAMTGKKRVLVGDEDFINSYGGNILYSGRMVMKDLNEIKNFAHGPIYTVERVENGIHETYYVGTVIDTLEKLEEYKNNGIEINNLVKYKPKSYKNHNTGHITLPQPLGSGVYVLAETIVPAGYTRTKPIAIEIYSDKVNYYNNGLYNQKVEATQYQGNLVFDTDDSENVWINPD